MYRQSSVSSGSWPRWIVGSMLVFAGSTAMAQSPVSLPRADGSEITYYVKQAASQPAKQLLVIMQGSDCNSVRNNPRIQEMFVPMLPNADVLTVEKYGVDASLAWNPEDYRTDCPIPTMLYDSLSQRVQDYSAVLKALQKQHGYAHVVVMGGEEGAITAVMLAAESDIVEASIAFNGGGRWFRDDVVYSEVSQLPADLNPDYVKGIHEQLDFLAGNSPPHAIVGVHGMKWWKEKLVHDQQAAVMKVDTPLLVIQAEQDTSVSPIAVQQMVNEVRAAGRTNVHYKTYPDLDHVFEDAQGENHMGTVINDMKTWLLEAVPPQS